MKGSALAYQSQLFAEEVDFGRSHARFNGRSGAFGDNMALPVHRWYRYSAGFSADWVRALIREKCADSRYFTVLDPFAGVGTTLLACEAEHVKGWGFEAHPFIHRIATAKIAGIHADINKVKRNFEIYLDALSAIQVRPPEANLRF